MGGATAGSNRRLNLRSKTTQGPTPLLRCCSPRGKFDVSEKQLEPASNKPVFIKHKSSKFLLRVTQPAKLWPHCERYIFISMDCIRVKFLFFSSFQTLIYSICQLFLFVAVCCYNRNTRSHAPPHQLSQRIFHPPTVM